MTKDFDMKTIFSMLDEGLTPKEIQGAVDSAIKKYNDDKAKEAEELADLDCLKGILVENIIEYMDKLGLISKEDEKEVAESTESIFKIMDSIETGASKIKDGGVATIKFSMGPEVDKLSNADIDKLKKDIKNCEDFSKEYEKTLKKLSHLFF